MNQIQKKSFCQRIKNLQIIFIKTFCNGCMFFLKLVFSSLLRTLRGKTRENVTEPVCPEFFWKCLQFRNISGQRQQFLQSPTSTRYLARRMECTGTHETGKTVTCFSKHSEESRTEVIHCRLTWGRSYSLQQKLFEEVGGLYDWYAST